MRLSVLEEILLPEGHSPEEEKTKELHRIASELLRRKNPSILTGFRSELRSYQEVGSPLAIFFAHPWIIWAVMR